MQIKTGFHAIEEYLKSTEHLLKTKPDAAHGIEILYSKAGPRVKKILERARALHIPCTQTDDAHLDSLAAHLNALSREHRGIVLSLPARKEEKTVDFDTFIDALTESCASEKRSALVVMLDSVTDPHNVGAVIRSCDQLGADLLVLPERRGASDASVIERASAGASSWVPTAVVTNLVRSAEKLREKGFWIYGAAANGTGAHTLDLTGNVVFVMGSEGSGIGRLLASKCDDFVSIPCSGKLDSLNVSVAAGILLYERRRQLLSKA